jgi:hypothetical protein
MDHDQQRLESAMLPAVGKYGVNSTVEILDILDQRCGVCLAAGLLDRPEAPVLGVLSQREGFELAQSFDITRERFSWKKPLPL